MGCKRRLGQHFLFNPRLLEYMVREAGVGRGDRVLEVGPGTGSLTRRLLEKGARVTALELDPRLCLRLREEFKGEAHLRIVQGDVLSGKHGLNEVVGKWIRRGGKSAKVVSNLPFSVATSFLLLLLEYAPELHTAVVTVQREVADRLAALPGSRAYGVASVLAQVPAKVEKLKYIKKGSFSPPPDVDACLLRLMPLKELGPPPHTYRELQKVVKWAFSERRKKLLPRLSKARPEVDFAGVVPPSARAEHLPPSAYRELAEILAGKKGH